MDCDERVKPLTTNVFTSVLHTCYTDVVEILQLEFDGFDWDSGNITKAQAHGLSLGEIEDFFSQELLVLEDKAHSKREKRKIAAGNSKKGRSMFVAFTMRQKDKLNLIRPISARFMHHKETENYEKLKKSLEA